MSHPLTVITTESKTEFYASLLKQLKAVLHDERDWIANLSQTSALLMQLMPELNWAGFYLFKSGELVLGPFQGRVACVRIKIGTGVCGTAAARQETMVVPNVHEFSGHIACDSASNSELVIPLVREGKLLGVLDLDSPKLGRFDDADAEGMASVVTALIDASDTA